MQLVSSCFCKRGPVEQATHLLWAGEPALGKKKKQALLKRKRALCSHRAAWERSPSPAPSWAAEKEKAESLL